jgi:hypothetical protein
MSEPKVIDILTFAGEGPVPCVRKTDYDALAARLAEAREWIEWRGHSDSCEYYLVTTKAACTCGRDKLLKALEAQK